jgi:hypothetical protein
MLEDSLDDDKIYKTNETLIPNFLRTASMTWSNKENNVN